MLVTSLTSIISSWKLRTFYFLVQREMSGGAFYGSAFCFLCAVNLLFALVAWAAVSIEPLAAGSGIPEVKCFLNGLNIPRLVRFRTLLCKMTGIVFAVAAGLPLGKEGPMVHAGAVIAAGVSQVHLLLLLLSC